MTNQPKMIPETILGVVKDVPTETHLDCVNCLLEGLETPSPRIFLVNGYSLCEEHAKLYVRGLQGG